MSLYKKIINQLIENNITVSVAESCTGGKLSKCFTDHQGVSKIFQMGLVTYSNSSKNSILNVSLKLINLKGAVSEEVARKMTGNLSKISKSKICISTTGIAGPNGGSKNKPVGLVFVGLKFNKKNNVYKKKFSGSRKEIQDKTIDFIFREIKKLL